MIGNKGNSYGERVCSKRRFKQKHDTSFGVGTAIVFFTKLIITFQISKGRWGGQQCWRTSTPTGHPRWEKITCVSKTPWYAQPKYVAWIILKQNTKQHGFTQNWTTYTSTTHDIIESTILYYISCNIEICVYMSTKLKQYYVASGSIK